jgi:hypothetical protein
MMSDHDDLESYWGDIASAQRGPIIAASDRPGNPKGSLELAAAKAQWDIQQKYEGATFPAAIVEDTVRLILDHWRNDLISRGPGGLIELVLEDQRLSTEELKSFVRALPRSLVQRIIDSGAASEKATGIHALLSVEQLWGSQPNAFRRDYQLRRDDDGTLTVTVFPSRPPTEQQGAEIVFRLDDTFDLTRQV